MRWILFAARIAVGAFFVYAGVSKLGDPDAFAVQIARYELTPYWADAPVARFLPWLEILAGLALATGTLTRGSAWLVALMSLVFTFAVSWALIRGLEIDCGCTGTVESPVSWFHVARNVVLLATSLAVAVGGWDALRLDRRLAGRYGLCSALLAEKSSEPADAADSDNEVPKDS